MFSELAHDPEKAFTKIVEDYGPVLLQRLKALCRGNGWEMEILNETFQRLWENRNKPSVVQHKNPVAWLTTVATRIYFDRYKKDKRTGKIVSRLLGTEQVPENSSMQLKELLQIIQQGLQQLTPMQRAVFISNEEAEQEQKQIAAKLGMEVQTYRNHLSQARKSMKQFMVKHYYGKG